MIRTNRLVIPVLLLAGVAVFAATDPGRPAVHVREVAPAQGKVGDVLKAHGDSLAAERVVEVYLTNGVMDYKVEVLEQTDHWFTFRIPTGIPAGRFRVAVITNDSPTVFEQPAFVKVIEALGPVTGD
jgi:hypothetical protein